MSASAGDAGADPGAANPGVHDGDEGADVQDIGAFFHCGSVDIPGPERGIFVGQFGMSDPEVAVFDAQVAVFDRQLAIADRQVAVLDRQIGILNRQGRGFLIDRSRSSTDRSRFLIDRSAS